MKTSSYVCGTAIAAVWCVASAFAQGQGAWLKHGKFITPGDLPGELQACLQKVGGRLMAADKATISLAGTLTDSDGSRTVRITVQAPGYLRFEDSGSSKRVLTFNGADFKSKNGKGGADDERIQESLMALLPDTLFLQMATGGGLRRIGRRFRADDGTTPNYAGPYWSLYAYSPAPRKGLAWGQALQQNVFIAVDESTWLISEVRIVDQSFPGPPMVTQTKFNRWFQQTGQWYPGEIVRLESGKEVLKFAVQQAATGGELPVASTFEP